MRKILVVCNDAGGAEIISSWVRQNSKLYSFAFLLEGPATPIFERKIQGVQNLIQEEVFARLVDFDLVLTGTGWASNLEKLAIKSANEKNIMSVAYIDHWTEYRQRFELNGELVLPKEIWVGDVYAQRLAYEAFPQTNIKLVPNLYLEEVVAEIIHLSPPRKNRKVRILYVSEPTSIVAEKKYGDARYYGYSEFEAFENYLEFLKVTIMQVEKIRFRPHPSEPPNKYLKIIAKFSSIFEIEESKGASIIKDCAWADWVVGCQSMAMVIGVLAQKKVFSCIPSQGAKLVLPYPQIEKLFQVT